MYIFASTYLPRVPSEQRAQGKSFINIKMMVTSTYNQLQISVNDQIELLKSDELIFQDEELARHLLENVSMFRMRNYLNPFR